ncbi:hypothetical protein N7456_008779 [Penicillium angulare]|uniref:Uncharacterized protein n=1 Tax=Penicillium angulare TaxID=116970 RepID=A0A9W9F3C1_9EURO|nr:hypothetical protein N7456_008779 [Penicillium angulare]
MPEDDPETFEIYTHWLYFKAIPEDGSLNPFTWSKTIKALVKAYITGDKIFARSFQNAVIDEIHRKVSASEVCRSFCDVAPLAAELRLQETRTASSCKGASAPVLPSV